MELSRGEAVPIFFAAGVMLFLSIAFCAFVYEYIRSRARNLHSHDKLTMKEPHPSSWKMCPNCVIELPVVTKQPVDNPQAPNKVPAITVERITTDANENLNTNDSELNDGGTSEVNLLPINSQNIEVHIEI